MKKTLDAYTEDIKHLHNELQRLPPQHPDYEKTEDKLSRQLSGWVNILDICVHVASNEQAPWDASEIEYPTIPMETKQASGVRQVGDYVAYLDDYDMFCNLLVERKGCARKNGRMISSDLYSSFSSSDNRRRFYAEVERFKKDNRFDSMVLISECSLGEYLSFKPVFNGKQYNSFNYGMNVPARRATIAKLYSIGCPMLFAGTRQAAVEMYHDLVIQSCRANYQKILNLE